MEGRRYVVAHEREEAGNGEGFVTVAQDLKVYGFLVVEVAEKRDDGVDGNHDEDSYDAGAVSSRRDAGDVEAYYLCSFGFK